MEGTARLAVASVCCDAVGSQVAVAHGSVLAMLQAIFGEKNSTYRKPSVAPEAHCGKKSSNKRCEHSSRQPAANLVVK